MEPSFGTVRDSRQDECEFDHDDEPPLGWGSGPQLRLGFGTDEIEDTAIERHGAGFVRSGPDDAEASLGWRNEGPQIFLAAENDDREADAGDEGEPDEGGEPTLGWPNNVGKGAATLTTTWRYQAGIMDGEAECRDRPEYG